MTVERIRDVHQARPFHPFRIHLAEGRNLLVKHPEFMSMSPTGRTLVVHLRDESMQIIDLLLVTSLELPNGRSRSQARGKRRR